MKNPFTIAFGTIPTEHISRLKEVDEITGNFADGVTQAYMITGVRGSGKTVLMTDIAKTLKQEGWIVIDLNPTVDMLRGLAAKLYDSSGYNKEFIEAKLNLSVLGIGVTMEKVPPISDVETAISRMLEIMKKRYKKVLIMVDEASNTEQMRQFVSAFQIMIRNGLPIYLLMTGLYKNLDRLQNSNEITFLLRTPRIILDPLNLGSIRESYRSTLGVDGSLAEQMALLTRGYAYAYQVLGYLYWNSSGSSLEDLTSELDEYLRDFVYSKVWSELSEKDRRIIWALTDFQGISSVRDLRESIGMSKETFSVYRRRLRQQGLIDTSQRGMVSLLLPRFAEYAAGNTTRTNEMAEAGRTVQPTSISVRESDTMIGMLKNKSLLRETDYRQLLTAMSERNYEDLD